MPIYHKHRLVHIHIPKTAGTAIGDWFETLGDMNWDLASWVGQQWGNGRWWEFQHLSMMELRVLSRHAYDTYRSFAVVRDPYHRLVSDYLWRLAATDLNDPSPGPRFDSFKSFIEAIPADIDRNFDTHVRTADMQQANFLIHVRPQHHYIVDATQATLVDEVFKFEDMHADLEKFGVVLPRVNIEDRRIFSDFYDRTTLARVNEIYSRDFEQFTYAIL